MRCKLFIIYAIALVFLICPVSCRAERWKYKAKKSKVIEKYSRKKKAKYHTKDKKKHNIHKTYVVIREVGQPTRRLWIEERKVK